MMDYVKKFPPRPLIPLGKRRGSLHNGSLHLILGPGPIGAAAPEAKAVMLDKSGNPLIPDHFAAVINAGDHRFHVVVEDRFGDTAEVRHRPKVAPHQGKNYTHNK